jgi:hypothetical protein
LTSMQVDPAKRSSPRSSSSGAPLATSEDIDQQGYAVPRDNLVRVPPPTGVPPPPPRPLPGNSSEYAQPVEPGGDRKQRPKHRQRREQIAMQQGERGAPLCRRCLLPNCPLYLACC